MASSITLYELRKALEALRLDTADMRRNQPKSPKASQSVDFTITMDDRGTCIIQDSHNKSLIECSYTEIMDEIEYFRQANGIPSSKNEVDE